VLVYARTADPATPFDSFEQENRWTTDSADDYAVLSLSRDYPSHGERCLRVEFEAFGRAKFQVRRDAESALAGVQRVTVDVYNGAQEMHVALGVRLGKNDGYYESPRRPLPPGWNRDIDFDLTASDFSHGDEEYTRSLAGRDRISGVALVFYEDANPRGEVFVDNVRIDYGPRGLARATRPAIRRITASTGALTIFEPLELTVAFDAAFQNFFDRTEIDLWATFFSPGGRKVVAHGFLYDYGGPDGPVWKVRFTPDESGRWVYDVTVRNRNGEVTAPLAEFLCKPDPRRRGFVRVSSRDKHCFEFDNGDFFYPVGENVAWASNMGYYLKRVSECGGNLVRVWLCPWHLPLEIRTEPGKYDLLVAKQLDALLDLAASYNVRVQLVIEYHGMLLESWPQNPFNRANKGPCRTPAEFFTNATAKQLFKRKLDYLAARWAHATHLFAWELWNEVDFAKYRRFEDVVAWHREMCAHLAQADPHRHLVTTSTGDDRWHDDLLSLDGIDFIAAHLYSGDLVEMIVSGYRYQQKFGKPYFLAEFAGSDHANVVRKDKEGVRLHAGLWASAMTPVAGSALSWWWDSHVEADDLYHHIRALAAFVKGEDRRGRQFEFIESELRAGAADRASARGPQAKVCGVISPSIAYLWIYDPERIHKPELAMRPFLPNGATFQLEGMLGGTFTVEIWDTYDGRAIDWRKVESRSGRLSIAIPPTARDVAVKVKKPGFYGPRIVP